MPISTAPAVYRELIDGQDGDQIIYCPKRNTSKCEWGLINNYTLPLNRCKEGLSLEKPGRGGVLVMGERSSFIQNPRTR